MKKMISVLLTLLLFAMPLSGIVQAAAHHNLINSATIEYLQNGDYIITELNSPSYTCAAFAERLVFASSRAAAAATRILRVFIPVSPFR